jgi:hypothetical protein
MLEERRRVGDPADARPVPFGHEMLRGHARAGGDHPVET